MKKFLSILLTFIMLFAFSSVISAQEANIISYARISVAMPEITAEINGSGYDKNNISANLDNEKLVVEDVIKYDNASVSSCTYILVDLSTSMRGSFALVKKNITNYINTLSENDKIVLITFGEKDVTTVLNGEEDRAAAISTVNKLQCNEGGTLFYEALNKVYQLSNSSISDYDREYVIAFSDGIDVQKGSSTFDEVLKLYNSHSLPLYAACSSNASKAAADKFGELARASGGSISIIKSEAVFNEFVNKLNDVTLIKMRADSNLADGKEKQLSLKIGDSMVECNVPISRSISDTTAPTVKDAYYSIEKDAFIISFSENVVGANENNAYKITYSNGDKAEVSDVFYSQQTNEYEVKTKNAVRKGECTIEFSGIRDDSKESNPIAQKCTIKVEKAKHRGGLSGWVIVVIAVVVLVAALAVVLVVVLSSNKKKNDDLASNINGVAGGTSQQYEYDQPGGEVIQHHIKTDTAVKVRFKIKTGRTAEQNIETSIASSIIIGRSNICDIYIDDTKLSRQHFVIENDNGNFYITDLQSRNGTMLNGIKINSRQQLLNGDKILAGLSEFIITIVG